MGANRQMERHRFRPGRSAAAVISVVVVSIVVNGAAAGASSREPILVASATTGSAVVPLVLGGAVLVLGGIGLSAFTWARRKRRPSACAEQREALALAERTVLYWEGARAHLEAVNSERTVDDGSSGEATHEALVAKAVAGLAAAVKERDRCQLALIHCMASGVPAVPVTSPPPQELRPIRATDADETTRSNRPPTTNR